MTPRTIRSAAPVRRLLVPLFAACATLLAACGGDAEVGVADPFPKTKTPRFVYRTDATGSGMVHAFTFNAKTGMLGYLGNYSAAQFAGEPVVHPNGKSLYVPSSGGAGDVEHFTINTTTGLLTTNGTTAMQIALELGIRPQGDVLYAPGSSTNVFGQVGLAATTGALGSPTSFGVNYQTHGIDVSLDGTYAVAANGSNNTLTPYDLDPATGAATEGGTLTTAECSSGDPLEIRLTPNKKFAYGVCFSTDELFAMSISGGVMTALPGSPFALAGTSPQGIAMHPAGGMLFIAHTTSSHIEAVTINASTGQPTVQPGLTSTANGPVNLKVDPSGTWLAVACQSAHDLQIYRIGTGGTLTYADSYTTPNSNAWGVTFASY